MNGALTNLNIPLFGQIDSPLFDRDIQMTNRFLQWLDLLFRSRNKPVIDMGVEPVVIADNEPEIGCNRECTPEDFTQAEKDYIYGQIQILAEPLLNGSFGSDDEAAIALHESEVKEYADELGLEFWAVIDPQTHEILVVSTGFHYRYAEGVEDYSQMIWWHTHPSGSQVAFGDIDAAYTKSSPLIYASGTELSKAETFGNGPPPLDFGDVVSFEVYENDEWVEHTVCVGSCSP